uniref:C-type lectin domain-containing protein n=1 Tax=Stegastes partitus TaxID=144197 RepID=A0A3B5A4I8_9TELE
MIYVFLTGWLILPSCPLRQYHFVNEPLTWHEAQAYCRERFTDLVTIEDRAEMNQVMNTVSSSGLNSEVWIGLYSKIDWRWSDGFTGEGSEYREWGRKGEPFFSVDHFCVFVYGLWGTADCSWKYPFVCYTVFLNPPLPFMPFLN